MTTHPFAFGRSILTIALTIALAVPMTVPGVAVAATDIPGDPIPASPVTGSLDASGTADDVFAVTLAAGESFSATLTGDPGTDFDLALYSPDAVSVTGPEPPLAESATSVYPEVITYEATANGTYHLDIQAFDGAGGYSAEWSTATAAPPVPGDDNISADSPLLPASPVAGTLDDLTDSDDVYKVHLEAGQKLDVSFDWTDPNPDASFVVALFDPSATDVTSDTPVVRSEPNVKPATLSYQVPETGDYYLDLYVEMGTGAYSLDYTIEAAPAPDGNDDISSATPLVSSPAEGRLTEGYDSHDLYSVDLAAGQTLDLALAAQGDPTPEFFVDLYAPGTGSIVDTAPVATADPSTINYVAPETGTYFIDVTTVDSTGDYSLSWTVTDPAPTEIGTSITVALPTSVSWATGVRLTAKLAEKGDTLVAGKTLVIEHKPYGAADFTPLAQLVTGADGRVRYALFPAKQTEYRVRFAGSGVHLASVSATKTCTPYAYLSVPSVRSATVSARTPFDVVGYLKPRHKAGAKSVRIFAQRYERQPNGSYSWVTRRVFYATNSNYSTYTKYSARIALPYRGKWRLRARIEGDTTHLTTTSSGRLMTAQ